MKPISTKMHGILDYTSAAALVAIPRIFGWNKTATRLLTGAALAHTGYSLLTNYELGVKKVIPMKTHLALDAGASMLLGTVPFLTQKVDRNTALGILGLSLYEAAVVVNSQNEPPPRFRIMEKLRKRLPWV
jgi:hypothetical protein